MKLQFGHMDESKTVEKRPDSTTTMDESTTREKTDDTKIDLTFGLTFEPNEAPATGPITECNTEYNRVTQQTTIPTNKPLTTLDSISDLKQKHKRCHTCRVYKAGGIAINGTTGDIAVSDIHAGVVKVWDSAGQFIKFVIPLDNKIPGSLSFNHYHPQDVAVGPKTSDYFVTDFSCFVQVYDCRGKFKTKFNAFLAANKPCCHDIRLTGLAFDNNNNSTSCLLVGATVYADTDKMVSFISKHDEESGAHLDTIPLMDIRPQFLAVTPQGNIVVTSWSDPWTTNTIHMINHVGEFLRVVSPPTTHVTFWRPAGICCTPDAILVANDNQVAPYEYGVYCFSIEGEYVGCATKEVINPTGITMSADGRTMLVTQYEMGNHLAGSGIHGIKIFGRE